MIGSLNQMCGNFSKDFAEMSKVNFFHELNEKFQIGKNHHIGMLNMSTHNSSEIGKFEVSH